MRKLKQALLLALSLTGTSALGSAGLTTIDPLYGLYYPQAQAMTGQMTYYPYNPYLDLWPVYVSNALNWNGAQPLGLGSMTPPIGLPFLQNRMLYGSIAERAI